jgi:transglutaminase-like putative cysteine protease
MELHIRHTTHYRYEDSVDLAQHVVHLSPQAGSGQTVRAHTLSITPPPDHQHTDADHFGNSRTFFSHQFPHEALIVQADSVVNTQAPRALPPSVGEATWEKVREHFRYRAQAPFEAASEYLFASPYVPRHDSFVAFAKPAFGPARGFLEASTALMRRIHTELRYESQSTEVNTPALQALAQGKGVCQDFAHIMIGCLRSLGLPARYVSGYLLTQPPPGRPRLIGADASHAWVSVYLPSALVPALTAQAPGIWVDFDPTNDRWGWGSPGEDYVTLAVGRDFADVSPMRGVIQGGAQHTLEVGVTVAPPEEFARLTTMATHPRSPP